MQQSSANMSPPLVAVADFRKRSPELFCFLRFTVASSPFVAANRDADRRQIDRKSGESRKRKGRIPRETPWFSGSCWDSSCFRLLPDGRVGTGLKPRPCGAREPGTSGHLFQQQLLG